MRIAEGATDVRRSKRTRVSAAGPLRASMFSRWHRSFVCNPGRMAKALFEGTAEVREIVKAPAQSDIGYALAGPALRQQIFAAVFKPAAPDIAHQRGLIFFEDVVDIARRQSHAACHHRGVHSGSRKFRSTKSLILSNKIERFEAKGRQLAARCERQRQKAGTLFGQSGKVAQRQFPGVPGARTNEVARDGPIPSCPGIRSAVQCSTLGTLSLSIGEGWKQSVSRSSPDKICDEAWSRRRASDHQAVR